LLVVAGVSGVVAAAGSAIWMGMHWGMAGMSQIAARQTVSLGASSSAQVTRAAILDLIPAPGNSLRVPRGAVPDDIAAAVKSTFIPLANPIFLASSDPHLVAWLNSSREKLSARRSLSEIDRGELQECLASTPLNWQTLFQIGKLYRDISGDPLTASRFCIAAAAQADLKLQKYENGATEARPALTAMNDARRLLWEVVDNVRPDPQCIRSLAMISADLARYVKPGDATLNDARLHGIIGVGECAYLMGENDRAIELLTNIDLSQMTDNERLGIAWISGMAFAQAGRWEEAAGQYQLVAADSSYQYSRAASVSLIVLLAKAGQKPAANGRLDDLIRRFHPSVEQVAPLLSAIDHGEVPIYASN
jgi:hypothetical protein